MGDRTPSTDALETLGMIHFKTEKRDAIHLAVEPVIAGEILEPGACIGIIDGEAYRAGTILNYDDGRPTKQVKAQGIVDPFLPRSVLPGESFWFIMNPRMVTSLRHVWDHPDFPPGA
jgi:hypothetical protein